MKVIKAMTIMHEIKEITILYTQSVFKSLIFDLYPAELSVPLFASLIIMSLFHVCIYKFDLMLHMLPEAHKNRIHNASIGSFLCHRELLFMNAKYVASFKSFFIVFVRLSSLRKTILNPEY